VSSLVLETEPIAVGVECTDEALSVALADGRRVVVPLSWYPRLWHASEGERANWRLLGDGYAIEWPDLDEHIGIEGIIAGRPGAESPGALKRWLDSRRA